MAVRDALSLSLFAARIAGTSAPVAFSWSMTAIVSASKQALAKPLGGTVGAPAGSVGMLEAVAPEQAPSTKASEASSAMPPARRVRVDRGVAVTGRPPCGETTLPAQRLRAV